jgi:hypothetical protein
VQQLAARAHEPKAPSWQAGSFPANYCNVLYCNVKTCLHKRTLTMGSCVTQRAVCWCACSAERMLMCVDAGCRLTGLRSCSTGRAATRSTVDCSCRRHPFAKRAQAYARGMGRRCMMLCWCGCVLCLRSCLSVCLRSCSKVVVRACKDAWQCRGVLTAWYQECAAQLLLSCVAFCTAAVAG